MVKFSRTYHLIVCVLLRLNFSLTSKFRASKALWGMHENVYCAKISPFKVVLSTLRLVGLLLNTLCFSGILSAGKRYVLIRVIGAFRED